MKNVLFAYTNGNYKTVIYNDGTKYRFNELDNLTPEFPESVDCKITNFCELNCNFCHEESSINGRHGDIINSISLFNGLPKGFELAIGGGNPLSHPDLIKFLEIFYNRGFICSLTINYNVLKNDNYVKLLNYLINNDLIKGVGISCNNDLNLFPLLQKINKKDNIVIHVINGIVNLSFILNIIKYKYKILILGFKQYGKGIDFFSKEIKSIEDKMNLLFNNISNLILLNKISFDNLAIKQLKLQSIIREDIWNMLYMGDDGLYTMYIDLVERRYSISSTSDKCNINNNNIIECFNSFKVK